MNAKKPVFKVIIAGGRDFTSYAGKNYTEKLFDFADAMLREKAKTHTIVIVSGKAKGADELGEFYAEMRGYEVEPYPAKWKDLDVENAVIKEGKFGKYNANAGFDRNETMAQVAHALIACWDGYSSGTKSMINLAKQYKLPFRILDY